MTDKSEKTMAAAAIGLTLALIFAASGADQAKLGTEYLSQLTPTVSTPATQPAPNYTGAGILGFFALASLGATIKLGRDFSRENVSVKPAERYDF